MPSKYKYTYLWIYDIKPLLRNENCSIFLLLATFHLWADCIHPSVANYGCHLFITVQVWVCMHVFMNISVHMCVNVWRGQKLTSSVIPQDIIPIVLLRQGLSLAWDLLIWLGGFSGICLSLSLSPGLGLLVHTITHTWLWFGCTFWGLI